MKRGGWLKRITGLKRPTRPMKAKNAERQKRRADAGEVYGPFHQHVKTLPCAVQGEHQCWGPVDSHHIRSVGAGGKDAGNCVPLCRAAHNEIHDIGPKRFNDKYFNDLKIYADVLYRRWTEEEL